MPEFLLKLKQQISEFWQNLDKSQKNRLYITSAIVVVAITIGIFLLTKPNNVILISNADASQVSEMKKILDDNKIWNEIGTDGSSLLVNLKDKGKARIAVSDKGYPKNGLTFEDAISMIGIGTTQSDKEHIWKQQEKSEIESMIMSYDNIEFADVNLAMPERTIFSTGDQEQPKPKAIVRITPKERLTQSQVQGIVMLVSRSVESLNPNDITVVDNNSNILNNESSDDSIDTANTQEKMRRDMEVHLESKVMDYFNVGQFDGFDTIRVVVNAMLDFDKQKTQTKAITNPKGMDGGAVYNSDTLKEDLTNGTVTGEPGVGSNPGDANAPSYQVGNGENSSYTKQQDNNTYGYDETVQESEKATGKLLPTQSTMAVSLWYGQRVMDDTKLSDDFINQVRLAASTATGIPLENISVSKLKLAPPEIIKKPTADIIRELITNYGFFGLMLLLILGLLIVAVSRKKLNSESEHGQLQPTASGPRYAVPEMSNDLLREIDLEEKSEVKKQIDKFVKQKPDAVAQLLRNWLSDDWEG